MDTMEKAVLYDKIENEYSQSVVNPANPFTIDNPDLLVFNGHILIALFIPLMKELRNPDLLLRRLYMSRLSLCKGVSSVLVIQNENGMKILNMGEVGAAFDAIYVYENDRDLINFLRDNIRQRNELRPSLRRQRMRRFWGTMEFIEKNGIVNNEYSGRITMREFRVPSWSCPNKKKYSRNVDYIHPYLLTAKNKTKQSFKDGYEDLITLTTMFNYTLSDGILRQNPEASDTFMFLNTEGIDDVMKNELNLRTLVFSGYLPGSVGEDFNMRDLHNRYYRFMKDGKYM